MTEANDSAVRMKRIAQQAGEACSWFVTSIPMEPDNSDLFACFRSFRSAVLYARAMAKADGQVCTERQADNGDLWFDTEDGFYAVVSPMSTFNERDEFGERTP